MSIRTGHWRLYVVLPNRIEVWPAYLFGRAIPTFTDRTDALSVLGFEPVPGAEWEWTEDSEIHDDPTSAAVLIAAIRVRSQSGVSV
ncbi:hypothetical protein ACZ90_69560 [Streptomyces albus subsp. albus]|nr:hypothetical protein ACZ90_69560 [Streptomyces albus subsp. albus]MBW3706070.1 hypothetical protein [Streptomyces griseus]